MTFKANTSLIIYFRCGKQGYKSFQCPNRNRIGRSFIVMNCETQKVDNIFILDSKCTQHMTKSNREKLEDQVQIMIANEKEMTANKIGIYEGYNECKKIKRATVYYQLENW